MACRITPRAAAGDEVRDFVEGHEPDADVFAGIEFGRVGEGGILDEDGVAPVAHDGGVGKHFADDAGAGAGVAGFLAEFADGAGHGIGFMGIEHAAGDFEFEGVGAVPVLFDHDQVPVRGDGAGIGPVDAIDDVEVMFATGARMDLGVGSDGEDAEISGGCGSEPGPGLDAMGIVHVGADESRTDEERHGRMEGMDWSPVTSSTMGGAQKASNSSGGADDGSGIEVAPGQFRSIEVEHGAVIDDMGEGEGGVGGELGEDEGGAEITAPLAEGEGCGLGSGQVGGFDKVQAGPVPP